MKTSLLLLILYMVIDILVCEVIEVKGPTETRHLNASAILDMAILRNTTNILDDISISSGTLNRRFFPWPITQAVVGDKRSPDAYNSASATNVVSSPDSRTPKSFYASANLPAKAPSERRQMIPAGRWTYPGWNEMSVKPKSTAMNNKTSNAEDIYDTATTDVQDKVIPLVARKGCRHRVERRKNEGINRQYTADNENTHGPDEDYTSSGNHYSSSNSEPEYTDVYAEKYVSQSGPYASENYDSYSPKSTRNNQYYGSSPDVYVGNTESLHRPRPDSLYSRFTVGSSASYADPGRGGASPSLIGIFFAIGSNLMQLFKIALGSGLSIAIPLIVIKLFLIPLKILKFIKIVKIFLKLIFVVPFILRVFAPSIYSSIGHRDSGFSKQMPSSESRHDVDLFGGNYTWLNDLAMNVTSALPDFVGSQKCPSRVACELGSYLARKNNISEKVINFFANDDLEESKDFNYDRNEKEEVTNAFLRALTQRWTYDRCEVFVCGFSL